MWRGTAVDRSLWPLRVGKAYPAVQELRERLSPLQRSIAFSQTFDVAANRGDALNRVILQLLAQHLHIEGMTQTLKLLVEQARLEVDTEMYQHGRSLLVMSLRRSLQMTEAVYDYTDKDKPDESALTEALLELGLIDEDVTVEEEADELIWEDVEEGKNIVYSSENTTGNLRLIKAASLNKLIIRLTDERGHDPVHQRTFLTTYRSFTTPETFLKKLQQRYHVPRVIKGMEKIGDEDWERKIKTPIQLRVLNVIRDWVKNHFQDFNERLLQELMAFLDSIEDDTMKKLATQIKANVDRKLQVPHEDRKIQFPTPPPEPLVPKNIFSPNLNIMQVNEEEVARQLTLIAFKTYAAIKPAELLNQKWNKPKLKKQAPNVLAMSAAFNVISGWVAYMCVKPERVRQRSKNMAKFIRIAEHLRSMNDFNTLQAILAGLANSAVYRLKYTKEDLSERNKTVRATPP